MMEGLRMLAIEKRSYPFQEKLLDAKTNEEKKTIRKQIRELKYVHVLITAKHALALVSFPYPNPLTDEVG